MRELTREQLLAIDVCPEGPARSTVLETGQGEILVKAADFDWLRGLLPDEADAPRRIDPRAGEVYVVLPEERYQRYRALFEEDPLSPAERRALLREAGKRAGWDDPVWDDEGEPRQP